MEVLRALETSRLRLRPLTMNDSDALWGLIYGDEEVRRYFSRTRTRAQLNRKLARQLWWNAHRAESGFGYYAIIRQADDAFLGRLNFGPPELATRIQFEGSTFNQIEVEVAYALGRTFWRQGYAREACQAIIEIAFKELRLPRLVNSVVGANIASIRLMESLGYRLQPNTHPDYAGWMVGILDNPWPLPPFPLPAATAPNERTQEDE